MNAIYHSRYQRQTDQLNWGRICGIAFAVTVQASLFMMLLVPPSPDDTSKDEKEIQAATIIEPPPPPPPPPPTPPKEIPKIIPKDLPPPPKNTPPPPPTQPPPPPVISNVVTPMSTQATPTPPAPPPPAVTMEASVDNAFRSMHPPEYPREALANGVTGTVVLLVTVSEDGEPINVTVEKSSHDRSLDRAAVEAAKKWKFIPKQENGRRVQGVVRVPVDFNL